MITVKTRNGHDMNLGFPKLMIHHGLGLIVLFTEVVLPPGVRGNLEGKGTCLDPGESSFTVGEYDEWDMEGWADFREELVMRNEFLKESRIDDLFSGWPSGRIHTDEEIVVKLTPEQREELMRCGCTSDTHESIHAEAPGTFYNDDPEMVCHKLTPEEREKLMSGGSLDTPEERGKLMCGCTIDPHHPPRAIIPNKEEE